jgi:twinkle protein
MQSYKKTHQPCPDCGSSDALTINSDNSTYCFSCKTRHSGDNAEIPMQTQPKSNTPLPYDFTTGHRTVLERGINRETCEKYNCIKDGETYVYGYTDDKGHIIAAKTRTEDKQFRTQGNWSDAQMYGQHLFNAGGKSVTICEGEFDAMAAYQMMGSKYAAVSVRNGAQSALKDAKANYEWISSFENIVICMDGDDVGKQAANQLAELFGSKCRIFKHAHDHKDACDYLRRGEAKEFNDRWWSAEQYVPDGIISGDTLLEEVMKPIKASDCDYPFPALNKLTYGIRKGELVTVTAGSGLGKSQFLREIVYHVLHKTEDNIGLLFLEEGTRKTGLSIMSLAANKPLHLPDCEASDEEKIEAFDATLGTGRLYLFDHFGSTSVDNIINRVRYMAKGLGCQYIFLDHVSIVVSAQASGDERKALDEIMTKLRMLVQETGVSLTVVSHLKRPEGKGHEEGAATSLAQLRGSGSIAQLSDMVIGLERNGQHDDPLERNTTHVRVLKNRFCGITGKATSLLYHLDTGRMTERRDEDEL